MAVHTCQLVTYSRCCHTGSIIISLAKAFLLSLTVLQQLDFQQISIKPVLSYLYIEGATPPPSDHGEFDDDEEEADLLAMETNPSPIPKVAPKRLPSVRGRIIEVLIMFSKTVK